MVYHNINGNSGTKIANWALKSEIYLTHLWNWPYMRVPITQHMKVWRDYIRGTFVKGINDIMEPAGNLKDFTVHPLFH